MVESQYKKFVNIDNNDGKIFSNSQVLEQKLFSQIVHISPSHSD